MKPPKAAKWISVASAGTLLVILASGFIYADQAGDLVVLADKIHNHTPGINFTITTEKFAYNISDPIFFTLTADRDCYVAVVDIGASGKATLLFPNKWHPDNKIEKGKVYRIPPEGSDFAYRVTGQVGTEHVKVIASLDQVMTNVRSLQQEIKTPTEKGAGTFLTMKSPELVLKDIRVAFSGIKPSRWAAGELKFQVMEVGASSSDNHLPGEAQSANNLPGK